MDPASEAAEAIRVAVEAMAPSRKRAFRELLVLLRSEKRASPYDGSVRDCWVVVEQGAKLIVYCRGGLTGRSESDAWGVLDADDASLGHDDCWYRSLDDAFIASGLCDRSLVPSDHEFL
jgi:hypothetical protein